MWGWDTTYDDDNDVRHLRCLTGDVRDDGSSPLIFVFRRLYHSSIVFRHINTCTYVGVTDTQILCRFSYFAIVCRPRHACRAKIGNILTSLRHVADMSPTFPAKTRRRISIANDFIQTSLYFGCFIRWRYSRSLPVSSSRMAAAVSCRNRRGW
jgi:hypothetical protein